MNNSSAKLVPLGELIKPHGIKGEIKVKFFNDKSRSLGDKQAVFLEDKKNNLYKYKIEKVIYSFHKDRVKFFEINSIVDAERLRGFVINVERSELPDLDKNQYYFIDLIKYKIIDISSTFYGYVDDVLHMPANDVLVISLDNKEHLIPMIDDVILNINHKSKEITIEPISGLFN